MLVFDSAYTFKIICERNVAAIVTGRDLDGYFEHVWTCHPVASLLEPEGSPERFGRPQVHELAPGHTMIEGRIGRFAWLNWFPILNFAIAQLDLLLLLLRIMVEEDIMIVRAEDPHYNGLFALLMSRLKDLPLLVGVWGNPAAVRKVTQTPLTPRLFRQIWVEERVERFVLRRADRVMAQNEDNRRFVVNAGVPRERTEIFRFGNLLHAAHLTDPASRVGGPKELETLGVGGEATLLVISRLQKLKLVDHVIEVLHLLKHRGRRVVALFVGEGPHRPAMEKLAVELGVAGQVHLLGNRDQDWLARVIPAVSIVVSPLTGRALAEAALGGAPVVAYDIDWHSELIETGVTGELVPYLDVEAMADAVQRILDDPVRAQRMGTALRNRAAQMLDPRAADRAQIAVYKQLFGSRRL